MSASNFLDSNVLIYAFDESEPAKLQIADRLIRDSLENGSGIISYQVVQETLNVLMRKVRAPMEAADALDYFQGTLEPLWRVQPSGDLMRSALRLYTRYSLSWYDSLIVAAALSAGCKTLLSEDLQDGLTIEGMTIENPFAGH